MIQGKALWDLQHSSPCTQAISTVRWFHLNFRIIGLFSMTNTFGPLTATAVYKRLWKCDHVHGIDPADAWTQALFPLLLSSSISFGEVLRCHKVVILSHSWLDLFLCISYIYLLWTWHKCWVFFSTWFLPWEVNSNTFQKCSEKIPLPLCWFCCLSYCLSNVNVFWWFL